jgi:pyridoxamine 5'-phosphate oxidase
LPGGNERTAPALAKSKHVSVLGTPLVIEVALFEFLDRGYYDVHMKQLNVELDQRYRNCLDALRQTMPEEVKWIAPGGGLVLWLEIPRRVELDELAAALKARNVAIMVSDPAFMGRIYMDSGSAIQTRSHAPGAGNSRRGNRQATLKAMSDGFLAIADLAPDPVDQFARWYSDAQADPQGLPHAMNLATVDADGRPAARMVLLNQCGPQGLTFYTNYQSRKAREMAQNPYVALVFYWEWLHRQVRVEGRVEKVTAAQSDAYFATRPRESQLSTWASPQSEPIASRQELVDKIRELEQKFGDAPIPRPAHWGGYRVAPHRFEFWASRPGRLHDRFCYELRDGTWALIQLAP